MLRLAFRWLLQAGIQPKLLVHDLQNHDELTYQLPELEHRRHEPFKINGETMSGGQLQEKILQEMQDKAGPPNAPWNLFHRGEKQDGVATTMVGFIAAGLRIDPRLATDEEKEKIKEAHLLVAMANAMQPGVFSLSAWDLVGALPLAPSAVHERISDGDNRWVNRGGVDLLGVNPRATKSNRGLPCAKTIYGPLTEQLKDETSFASQLKRMLVAREKHKIAHGKLKSPPPEPTDPKHRGVCLLALQLPEKPEMPGRLQLAVTALNFGDEPAEEVITFSELFGDEVNSVRNWRIIDAVTDAKMGSLLRTGRMTIRLHERAGKTILIQQR